MSKVTIEDISRHTGLSRGTVSRALNDRPDISEQTKTRVLMACRQLNYVPSHAARSLATGRRYAVAIVVDDLRSVFASCFTRGVIGRARAEHYAVHVTELAGDVSAALDHLKSLVNERVDTVLLANPLSTDLSREIAEAMNGRPLVAGSEIAGVPCDVFCPDYLESGRLTARHIVRSSTPNVLYVHEDGPTMADQRLAGFREVCRSQGVDPEQVTISVPSADEHNADRLEAVRSQLANVQAIACTDDYLAVETMLLCAREGRFPGRDIAIMGQGNELISSRIHPQLTSIDFCGEEIGHRAMDIALQRITKQRQDAAQTTSVSPVLVTRASTRPVQ